MSDVPPACPVCARPAQAPHAPFCSRRCRMKDLGHWIGSDEPYVIEGDAAVPGPEDAES